jgi:Fe-S cluster biogenesis protein NfuA
MTDKERSEKEKQLREDVDTFLMKNFPQIQMHGGTSSVIEANPDKGYVKIQLGGACSGCGISPMTTQAIRTRMPDDIENVEEVEVDTGSGGGFGMSDDPDDLDDIDDLPSI